MEVYAFDTSIEGKNKALKLAKQNQVDIHYEVGEFLSLQLVHEKFDVAALIFAHFDPDILPVYHKKVAELLKPNGLIIIEGFSKNHRAFQKINPKAGGPKDLDLLFSIENIQSDFPNFEIIKLEEVEVNLVEGKYHDGNAKVIQFISRKKP